MLFLFTVVNVRQELTNSL